MAVPVEANSLRANRLLALLTEGERARLARHLSQFRLDIGSVIQREENEIEYVYFPVSGIVASTLLIPDEAEVTVAITGDEGALFCDSASALGRSAVKATVRNAGVAWRLPFLSWRELAASQASDVFAAYSALCVSDTQQNAACCLLHDVESRLCRWMLHVHDRMHGAPIAMTHADLASLAGTRRTTVTLVTGTLQAAGIIENRRGKIEVTDRFALEASACDCYQLMRDRREDFESRSGRSPAGALDAGIAAPELGISAE